MDDIKKFFQSSSSKKRELGSSNSETNDDPKKMKEGSSSSNDVNEVFDRTSTSSDTNVTSENVEAQVNPTLEAIKGLELKIRQLFELANKTNESQIKGESQLVDLKKSVDLISTQFDEYEKERVEREEKIKNLEKIVTNINEKVSVLNKQVGDLDQKIEKQEQYSRRNCLLIHGVTENKDENTDDVVLSIFKDEMDIEIFTDDLDRTHRIGKTKDNNKHRRPIIVKFASHNDKHKVLRNKKRLKGKKISITESLTKTRMAKLNEARDVFSFTNVWTSDGRILYKQDGEERTKIYYD